MPKKKTQFPKRDKQIKRTAIIGSISAIVLIAAIAIPLILWNNATSWILEFDGNRAHVAEFEFFARETAHMVASEFGTFDIFEGSDNDWSGNVKEWAMTDLQRSLGLAAFARQHNVSLPAELLEEAQANADAFKADYRLHFGRNNRISDQRLLEIMSEMLLLDIFVEQLGQNVMIENEDFIEFFEEYLDDFRFEYLDIYLTIFLAESPADAANFMIRLEQGEDFRELVEELSPMTEEVSELFEREDDEQQRE